MLASLCFRELVDGKIEWLELPGRKWPIDVVQEIRAGFPAQSLELQSDGFGLLEPVVAPGVIARAAVEIDPDWFFSSRHGP